MADAYEEGWRIAVSVRVGIDARRYSPGGRGQERYVRCLVHALAARPGDHRFVLFTGGMTAGPPLLAPNVRSVSAGRRLRLQYRRRLTGIRRILLRDIDLVHFPLADGWYERVMRTVVTVHDLSVLRYPGEYFSTIAAANRARAHHERITANADAVITPSPATARDVVELLGIPQRRVTVVPHGVERVFLPVNDPVALERVHRLHGLPDRYLLFVGGIDFKKNVARLIEGFAIARRKGGLPHALVLVGPLQRPGNPFFDTARERAARAGVADHVTWAGYVPEADLPSFYSAADAFVFPSLMEGFGFPVLEAMACGTPVVTSAGSAMAEITGDDAALVDPEDPGSIADGILDVLSDGVGTRLSRAGLRRASGYTWEYTAARTIEVYERVVRGAPVPAEVPA